MSKWYGSLINRLEENKMYCKEITVGTGMTEYSWSDRHAYEVIEVVDQKHVVVREYDHIHQGDGYMDNSWKLVSNVDNPSRALERRGNVWYWTSTLTADDVRHLSPEQELRLALAGYDIQRIRDKGKQTKRRKANVSFGVADYYYDYSF